MGNQFPCISKIQFSPFQADLFSVGIVAFELYCPFQTYAEKLHAINQVRRGQIPEQFQLRWPTGQCDTHCTYPLSEPPSSYTFQPVQVELASIQAYHVM